MKITSKGASAGAPAASGPTSVFTPANRAGGERRFRERDQLGIFVQGHDMGAELGEDGARIACSAGDMQDLGALYRLDRLQHARNQHRSERMARFAGRFDAADFEMLIAIGERLHWLGQENLARQVLDGGKQRAMGDIRGADLVVDHAAAEFGEIEHGVIILSMLGFIRTAPKARAASAGSAGSPGRVISAGMPRVVVRARSPGDACKVKDRFGLDVRSMIRAPRLGAR